MCIGPIRMCDISIPLKVINLAFCFKLIEDKQFDAIVSEVVSIVLLVRHMSTNQKRLSLNLSLYCL